jgi:alanine dehydrogenase
LAARSAGVQFAHKTVSLNQLFSGGSFNRPAYQLPLFKSVGSAVQDVVVAGLALERAIHSGSATQLPIDFYIKRP